MLTMTWEEFLNDCDGLINLSNQLQDGWEIIPQGGDVGQTYLKITEKITENLQTRHDADEESFLEEQLGPQTIGKEETKELITIEYHVIYSLSYQVPILFFRGYRSSEYIQLSHNYLKQHQYTFRWRLDKPRGLLEAFQRHYKILHTPRNAIYINPNGSPTPLQAISLFTPMQNR